MFDYSEEGQKKFYEWIEELKLKITLSERTNEDKKKFYSKIYRIEEKYNRSLEEHNRLNNPEKKEGELVLKIRETNKKMLEGLKRSIKAGSEIYLNNLKIGYSKEDENGVPKYMKN